MQLHRPRTTAALLSVVALTGCGVVPVMTALPSSQPAGVGALAARVSEPLTRVAPEYVLETGPMGKLKSYAEIAKERAAAGRAPGYHLGLNATGKESSQTMANIRAKHPNEAAISVTGIQMNGDRVIVQDVPNPDAPDGSWNPLQYAPNFHFDAQEDSYPVVPGFDGDQDYENDPARYRHGQIGGQQPVSLDFSVSRKGSYYVLQYSSYFVDNKVAAGYHVTDSSTVAVYLQPGVGGKLAPAYVYTSWHFGAILAPWDTVQKDASGHPNVQIGRGSHSARPVAPDASLPADGGLVIRGDGRLSKRGSSAVLPNKLQLTSSQPSVKGALQLAPDAAADQFALQLYFGWHPGRRNPYHPSLFTD